MSDSPALTSLSALEGGIDRIVLALFFSGESSGRVFVDVGDYRALKPDLDIRTIRVRLRRLETLLAEHAPEVRHIDVLSINVEGWELEVIAGVNIDRYKPRVTILENLLASSAYPERMRSVGYVRWKTIPPNDIYVPELSVSGLERVWIRVRDRLVPGWNRGVRRLRDARRAAADRKSQ